MTSERRLLVGVADIKAVTLECHECHARLTVSPDKFEAHFVEGCRACKTGWGLRGNSGKPLLPSGPRRKYRPLSHSSKC
jgi:hypothetical protein